MKKGRKALRGLYIHIPFCVQKCRYCDFVSFPGREAVFDDYISALSREAEEYRGQEIDTVFIGGGTPSVLMAKQLDRLFCMVNSTFKIKNGAEFSIEVNPGTVNAEKIAAIKNGGVNRVSIGVQSFNDAELQAIGRIHSAAEAKNAVLDFYNAGFLNISIDIMTSLPKQTKESLMGTLKIAVELPVKHISAYSLILEEGTPIYADYKNGVFTPLSEDADRDMFAAAVKYLHENGFSRYEISNFAKDGYESCHNKKYWECREYIGIGLAAHSYMDKKRFYNTSELNKYLRGEFHCGDVVCLTKADMISEFMMMGLRMTRGVSECEFYDRFGKDIMSVYHAQIERFINSGCMVYKDGHCFLTDRGMDVSNSVMCEFILTENDDCF